MAENETLQIPEGAWEGRLRAGLRDLEAGTPGGGLPGAGQARRTHRRRRTALAAGSALAAVVVAGGTVLALTQPAASPPVAPTTTEPAPNGTAAPTPTGTTTSPRTSTSTEPAGSVPTTIPDDFVLYASEPAHDPDVTDWTETTAEPLTTCAATTGPREVDRPTDSRATEQTGPEFMMRVELRVFAHADSAAAFLSLQRQATAQCLGRPTGGREITVVDDLPGSWGQGALWVESYPGPDGDAYSPGGTYTLVMRVGSAVASVVGYSEWPPAVDGPDPAAVEGYRQPLDELAPRLCLFTQAGC